MAQRNAAYEKVFRACTLLPHPSLTFAATLHLTCATRHSTDDANKDALLDEKEVSALLVDLIKAQRSRVPQEVAEIVDMSARVMAKQHTIAYNAVRPQLVDVEKSMCEVCEHE